MHRCTYTQPSSFLQLLQAGPNLQKEIELRFKFYRHFSNP